MLTDRIVTYKILVRKRKIINVRLSKTKKTNQMPSFPSSLHNGFQPVQMKAGC